MNFNIQSARYDVADSKFQGINNQSNEMYKSRNYCD